MNKVLTSLQVVNLVEPSCRNKSTTLTTFQRWP